MTRLAAPLLAGLDAGRRLSEAAATLTFATMVGLFGYTVWQRYVVGVPSRWSDELCVILFLWVVFGAAALVVPYRDHIAVGLVHEIASPRLQRIMDVLGPGIAGAILLAALPVTLDYIGFLWRERSPALRWPFSRVYLVFGLFQGMIALRMLLIAATAALGRALPEPGPQA
jgi:TRAP-type C4-dicarboxylate transport system permease small subunit